MTSSIDFSSDSALYLFREILKKKINQNLNSKN
jgi:hypothetical protein